MIKKTVEQELRFLLLGLSGLAFVGAVIELLFIGHYENFIQVIPFILSGLGLLMILLLWKKSGRKIIRSSRYICAIIVFGSLFGIYEHVNNNVAFEMEIHPEYTLGTALWEALGGATPLMAPGILMFAALLALASTWRHPVLRERP